MARHQALAQPGFSLFEVLIGLFVVAILAVVAIPNYRSWQQQHQFEAQAKQLQNLLTLARSSAIEHNQIVTVCPSASHQLCDRDWSNDVIAITDRGKVIGVFAHGVNFSVQWRSSLARNDRLQFSVLGGTQGQQGSFYCRLGANSAKLTLNRAGRIKRGVLDVTAG